MHQQSNGALAVQTTLHCLMGCGVGDILGVVIGTLFGISYVPRIALGVVFGFVFGFVFSLIPMLRAQITFRVAAKIILTTEIISILAMEAAEATTELLFPGMKKSGIGNIRYWVGLLFALASGFIVAFPVNFFLVKKGIRHHH